MNNNFNTKRFDSKNGLERPPQPSQQPLHSPIDQLPIGTGTSVNIDGIPVEFPYDPYQLQIDYMTTVIRALSGSENALLESPTGTGKTLCLLCSALAWLLYQKKSTVHLRTQPSQQQAIHQVSNNLKQPLAVFATNTNGVTTFSSNPNNLLSPSPTPFGATPATFSTLPSPAFEINQPDKIRIIYAARTHSQLTQVVRELQKTSYGARIRVLAGRQHLCLNESVRRQPQALQRSECSKLVNARSCQYRTRLDQFLTSQGNSILNNEMLDIEDILERAHEERVCAYYWTRTALETADLILVPYQYVIDPVACSSIGLTSLLPNSILIFDEAHNLEATCTESASLDLPISLFDGANAELSTILSKLAQKDLDQGTVSLALNHQIDIPLGTPAEKIQEYSSMDEHEAHAHLQKHLRAGTSTLDNNPTSGTTYNPEGVISRNNNNTNTNGDDWKVQEAEYTFTAKSVEQIKTHIFEIRNDIIQIYKSQPSPTRTLPPDGQAFDLRMNSGPYLAYDPKPQDSKTALPGLVFYGSWLYNILFRRLVFTQSDRKKYNYDHSTHPILQTDFNYVQNNNSLTATDTNSYSPDAIQEDKRWIWSSSKDNVKPLPAYFDTVFLINSLLRQLETMAHWYIYGESTGPVVNGVAPIDDDQRDENGEIDISAISSTNPKDINKDINDARDRQASCQILSLCELLRNLFQRSLSELYFHQLNYYFRCYIDFSSSYRDSLKGQQPSIHGNEHNIVLSLWCFSASVIMNQILENQIRTVILTSGTLAPLSSYKSEMGIPFKHELENKHVVGSQQMAVHILGNGPTGQELTSKYNLRDSVPMWQDLGRSIAIISQAFRSSGVLSFFPSYGLMASAMQKWKAQVNNDIHLNEKTGYYTSSILHLMSVHHTVFFESRDSGGSDVSSIIARKRQERYEKDKNKEELYGGDKSTPSEPVKKTFGAPTIGAFLAKGQNKSFKSQNNFGVNLGNSRASAYQHADPIQQTTMREKMNFNESMIEYKRVIEHAQKIVQHQPSSLTAPTTTGSSISDPATKGAMLFGICRGKASEGIDFSDSQARVVFIVGIPYSSQYDPKVVLKRSMLDGISIQQTQELSVLRNLQTTLASRLVPPHLEPLVQKFAAQKELIFFSKSKEYFQRQNNIEQSQQLRGQFWYTQSAIRAVNQAIGRVIRHRYDYGAVVLVDSRFSQPDIQCLLAKWIRDFVKVENFKTTVASMRSFVKSAPITIAENKKRDEFHDEELRQRHAVLTSNALINSLDYRQQQQQKLTHQKQPTDFSQVQFTNYQQQPNPHIDLSMDTKDNTKSLNVDLTGSTTAITPTTSLPSTVQSASLETSLSSFHNEPITSNGVKRSRLGVLQANQSVTLYSNSRSSNTTVKNDNKISIDQDHDVLNDFSKNQISNSINNNAPQNPTPINTNITPKSLTAQNASLSNHKTSSTGQFVATHEAPQLSQYDNAKVQPSNLQPFSQTQGASQYSQIDSSSTQPTIVTPISRSSSSSSSTTIRKPIDAFTQVQLRQHFGSVVWCYIRIYLPLSLRSQFIASSTSLINKHRDYHTAVSKQKGQDVTEPLLAFVKKAAIDAANLLLTIPEILPIQSNLFLPTTLSPFHLCNEFSSLDDFCQKWSQVVPPAPINVQPPPSSSSSKPTRLPLSSPQDIAFLVEQRLTTKTSSSLTIYHFPYRFRSVDIHQSILVTPSGHMNPALYTSTPLFHPDPNIAMALQIALRTEKLPPLLELTDSQRIHISNLYRNPESLIQNKTVHLIPTSITSNSTPHINKQSQQSQDKIQMRQNLRPMNDNLLLALNNVTPTPDFDFQTYVTTEGQVCRLLSTPNLSPSISTKSVPIEPSSTTPILPFTQIQINHHPIQHQSQLFALVLPRHCFATAFLCSLAPDLYTIFRNQLIEIQNELQHNTDSVNKIRIDRQDLNILPKPRYLDIMQQVRTVRSWYLDYLAPTFHTDVIEVASHVSKFMFSYSRDFLKNIPSQQQQQQQDQQAISSLPLPLSIPVSLNDPTLYSFLLRCMERVSHLCHFQQYYQNPIKKSPSTLHTSLASTSSSTTLQQLQPSNEPQLPSIKLSLFQQPPPLSPAPLPHASSTSTDALQPQSSLATLSSSMQSNNMHPPHQQPPQSPQQPQQPQMQQPQQTQQQPQPQQTQSSLVSHELRDLMTKELDLGQFRTILSIIHKLKQDKSNSTTIESLETEIINFCSIAHQRQFRMMGPLIDRFEFILKNDAPLHAIFIQQIKPKLVHFL